MLSFICLFISFCTFCFQFPLTFPWSNNLQWDYSYCLYCFITPSLVRLSFRSLPKSNYELWYEFTSAFLHVLLYSVLFFFFTVCVESKCVTYTSTFLCEWHICNEIQCMVFVQACTFPGCVTLFDNFAGTWNKLSLTKLLVTDGGLSISHAETKIDTIRLIGFFLLLTVKSHICTVTAKNVYF